jgi:signal transduction histidine kinase
VANPDVELAVIPDGRWADRVYRLLGPVRPLALAGRTAEPLAAAVASASQLLVVAVAIGAPAATASVSAVCVLAVAAAAWLFAWAPLVAVVAVAVTVRILAAAVGGFDWIGAFAQSLLTLVVAASVRAAATRRAGAVEVGGPEPRVGELTFLLRTAQLLSSSLDSSVILRRAVEATAQGISRPSSSRPARASYNEVRGDLLIVATVQDNPPDQGVGFTYAIARDQGSAGALRSGRAALVRPDHMSGELRTYVDGLGQKVLIMAQVRVADETEGLLVASARDHGAVDRAQLRLLEVIAHMTGLALGNAQLLAHERVHAREMESLEKVKSEILNLVSHELRSPLTVARGYVSLLNEGSLGTFDERTRNILPIVADKLSEMESLVQQMLEASRLEAGELVLHRERVDLRRLAGDAVQAVRQTAEAGKGHELRLQLPEEPVVVDADPGRIATVLGNLLRNAITYSPDGGVVTCSVSVNRQSALVSVSDQGIGIAPEDLTKLFSRFGRLQNRKSRGISGTGLGLYLSRQIALQHGGDISVASELGRGSTFSLSLPRLPRAVTSRGARSQAAE